jgi:hypothetical protein
LATAQCGRIDRVAVPRPWQGEADGLRAELEAELGVTLQEGRLLVDVDRLQELRRRQPTRAR